VPFAFERVDKLMGLKLDAKEIRRTLEALGFVIEGKGPTYTIAVPSWRPDVHGPADLVEEVSRIAGLETIASAPLPRLDGGVTRATLTDTQKRVRRSRRVLAARGMVEAITWSFIKEQEAQHFGGGAEALMLANPISSEMTTMRPSLLPGLLAAAQRNRNRGFSEIALFEVGQAYRGDDAGDQFVAAAGVRAGGARVSGSGRHWDGAAKAADVFDAKADAMALLASLGLDVAKVQITRDAPAWFHPGRSGTLRLGPKTVLAHFGEVHPATLKLIDVAGPVAAFEVFLGNLPPEKRKSRAKPALDANDLLPVKRDFAFVLAKDVAAGDVVKAAERADKALISNVAVFDLFEGGSLGADKKSLAIEVTLTPKAKTLTDEEIDAVASKIVAEVKRATGGEIRG
jgi:phenylalanyl-tRNA synthetase beta chain